MPLDDARGGQPTPRPGLFAIRTVSSVSYLFSRASPLLTPTCALGVSFVVRIPYCISVREDCLLCLLWTERYYMVWKASMYVPVLFSYPPAESFEVLMKARLSAFRGYKRAC